MINSAHKTESNMHAHMTRIDNTYTIQYLYRSVILQSQQSSCYIDLVLNEEHDPNNVILFQVHTATADLSTEFPGFL